ncbi:MAG: C45 family peptidase, partial [Planctomycetes bacterium]|nr:C45 family peptidase [Planctomycetota bacterium]
MTFRLLAPALLAAAALCPSALAGEPPKEVKGRLFETDGVRVLRVWGTPRERGYAHGALAGAQMIAIVNAILTGDRAETYKQRVPMLLAMFRWPPHLEEEMRGVLEGVEATLPPDKRKVAALGRAVSLEDVKAFNCLGDWSSMGCSTFSAWGNATEGGRTIVGRNFDYLLPLEALQYQLILAEEAAEGRKAFLTLSFPGNLGAITFLNEGGVFGSVHDVHVLPRALNPGFCPRLAALRLIAEGAEPGDASGPALKICREKPTFYGNVFHLASPFRGGAQPAAAIEYDSLRDQDSGATLRLPEGEGAAVLWNTNHYRVRSAPEACRRYEALGTAFEALAAAGKKIGVEEMKDLIRKASVDMTINVTVADLEARTLHVALQKVPGTSAAKEPFHKVR